MREREREQRLERENRENGERTDKMERENGERERERTERMEREREQREWRETTERENRENGERERTQIVFFLTVHCTCSNLKNLHVIFLKVMHVLKIFFKMFCFCFVKSFFLFSVLTSKDTKTYSISNMSKSKNVENEDIVFYYFLSFYHQAGCWFSNLANYLKMENLPNL